MEALDFLVAGIGDRQYLCAEKAIEKVIQIGKKDIFASPYGPELLGFLFLYNDMPSPLFALRSFRGSEDAFIVLVVRIGNEFAGFAVDSVKGFVSIDETTLAEAADEVTELTTKTVMYHGEEYHVLDADALFEVKE